MLQKKSGEKKNPGDEKVQKKASDSCHIPSNKEVRSAPSEVKLQEQSAFSPTPGKKHSFISALTIVGKKKRNTRFKEDKHL